jgi:5-methylcytosine-specific restriction endonuclease McrA
MEQRTCTLDGCGGKHYGKGFCVKHYKADHHQRNLARSKENRAAWLAVHPDYASEYAAAYYVKHAELLKARAIAWSAANPERKQANDRAWVLANPERKRTSAAAWYAADPARNRVTHASWYAANKIKGREAWHRRRARKHANGYEVVSFVAILARDGMFCYLCQTEISSRSDLHFDHVTPLSKGGPHRESNLKPTHARCNLSKGSRILTD